MPLIPKLGIGPRRFAPGPACNDLTENCRLLLGRAAKTGLMRKFEPDPTLPDPANQALHQVALAKTKPQRLGKVGAEVASHHRPAARQVQEVHIDGAAVELDPCMHVPKGVPSVGARFGTALFGAPDGQVPQISLSRRSRMLRPEKWLLKVSGVLAIDVNALVHRHLT